MQMRLASWATARAAGVPPDRPQHPLEVDDDRFALFRREPVRAGAAQREREGGSHAAERGVAGDDCLKGRKVVAERQVGIVIGPEHLVAGAAAVVQRLGVVVAFQIVIREPLGVQPFTPVIQLLQQMPHLGMKPPAPPTIQFAVHHLMDQRVVEGPVGVGLPAARGEPVDEAG